jgi:tRNA G18 (ribose-2'-O)-methylase SpoU
MRLFGCLAGARRRMFDVDLRGPTMLAVGGEKRGLSAAVRELCNEFITIPSIGGPSSLALSHACAILLAEAMRQRTSIA